MALLEAGGALLVHPALVVLEVGLDAGLLGVADDGEGVALLDGPAVGVASVDAAELRVVVVLVLVFDARGALQVLVLEGLGGVLQDVTEQVLDRQLVLVL